VVPATFVRPIPSGIDPCEFEIAVCELRCENDVTEYVTDKGWSIDASSKIGLTNSEQISAQRRSNRVWVVLAMPETADLFVGLSQTGRFPKGPVRNATIIPAQH
jgi:hypothetical protein